MLRQAGRIRDVPAAEWDALFGSSYPFTHHAFLQALEDHGCVGGKTGWEPCHWVLEDQHGQLLGAAPLYRKRHSYGEFVFDGSWARASHDLGRSYYPKLVSAVPFTPVTGPRFAVRSAEARRVLIEGLYNLPGDDVSSTHALFLEPADSIALRESGFLERWDIQFHWRNQGPQGSYTSFADFLNRLESRKRKNILRERRRVTEAGLRFSVSPGCELSEAQWAEVYALYSNTYEERGQAPYLTLDFFLDYGRRPDTPVRLILAHEGNRCVAVAITLVGGDTLYGRHWGACDHYHSLHFETCYYQGIELCIREGLTRFDAGAQGEHKLARGFDPVLTRSAHRLRERRLHIAVAEYLERERPWVEARRLELAAHSSYRMAETVVAGDG